MAADGGHQAFCTQTALDGDGELWAYAAHGNQPLEDALLFPIEKTVERQGIFTYVGMDKERDLGSLERQRAKGRHADHYVIANAAGFDDRLLWIFRK